MAAPAVGVVFEGADDGEQVGLDGAVHFGKADVAVGFGAGNQSAGGDELVVVLGSNSAVVTNSGQVRQASLN
ncbi:hypothetical protein [Mycolicibacterium sp.]|uniref:hypothetical protein n=2 Tax=Mycolicibacterium sp. TaxID=2320850 RepID=UPI0037C7660C